MSDRGCPEHDFVDVRTLEVEQPGTTRYLVGKVIVCAYCGHKRIVWEDGKVEIIKDPAK